MERRVQLVLLVSGRLIYLAETSRQLLDISSYLPLDHNSTNDNQATVSQTATDLIRSEEFPFTTSNLIMPQPHNFHYSCWLLLHRTYSSYLDSILSPLVQSFPIDIQNTLRILHHFDNCQFPCPYHLIFTMDIQLLYSFYSYRIF